MQSVFLRNAKPVVSSLKIVPHTFGSGSADGNNSVNVASRGIDRGGQSVCSLVTSPQLGEVGDGLQQTIMQFCSLIPTDVSCKKQT